MELIMQILDVAKLASGKIKLDPQAVDLNELAKTPSLNTLAEVARKKGLEFSWNIDYNVPEIRADPNRLLQVFANLIGNAIKFTDKGSIKVNVSRKGKNVRVEVSDTGMGIGSEDQSKLFRKFYQLQRKGLTKQEGSGTGLGLSIAKGIVNLHGGTMHVISGAREGQHVLVHAAGIRKAEEERDAKAVTRPAGGPLHYGGDISAPHALFATPLWKRYVLFMVA